jgi:MFS family permease
MKAPDASKRNVRLPTGAWRIVALLVAFSYMSWFNRVSMAVAYDTTIGPDDGVSEEAIGTVYSAFFLSYLLFMTPGGWFIDHFGPRRALLVMGLGSGLFGALTSCAGLPALQMAGLLVTALLLIRFFMGLVSAPIYPASARMVATWVPMQQRTFANGLIQAAALVGMACAFPLFGKLIDAWDWPAAFLASGIVTMFLGVLWWLWAADHPALSSNDTAFTACGLPARRATSSLPPHHTRPWFTLLRNRNVMLLTVSYAAVSYLEYLFFFWMNHYFGNILHIPKERSRIYTAILYLSMAVGIAGGGWLADSLRKRFGPWSGCALVPMAGMVLGAIFLGFGIVSEATAWIVFWMALALLAVGAAEGPVWTAAVEFGGRRGGTAAAIVNTGGNLGGFIAPFLTPIVSHAVRDSFALSDQAGWQWGIALAGVFCLSGAMLWWWIRPEREHFKG